MKYRPTEVIAKLAAILGSGTHSHDAASAKVLVDSAQAIYDEAASREQDASQENAK